MQERSELAEPLEAEKGELASLRPLRNGEGQIAPRLRLSASMPEAT